MVPMENERDEKKFEKSFKFRDKDTARSIIRNLEKMGQEIIIMHVCGGHQDTLVRYGLDDMLKDVGVDVRQGPGCPVCVTPPKEIEEVMFLANKGKVITVFGDMMRVPGEKENLFDIKAKGGDVRMVYSIEDAVKIARENPQKEVVFMAIGFETTAPSTASIVLNLKELETKEREESAESPVENFSILSTHRIVPPALRGIIEMGEVNIQGLVEPGHVSTIIGTRPYEFLSRDYGIPQVIAGFEPLDLLMSIYMLAKQIQSGEARVENAYTRVVREMGNVKAIRMMEQVFEVADVSWRGFGTIPASGLVLRENYSEFDARKRYGDLLEELEGREFKDPPGCRCGEVLRGVMTSDECPLFGKTCTPATPVGPCMVTSEGSCNIMLKYGKKRKKKKE